MSNTLSIYKISHNEVENSLNINFSDKNSFSLKTDEQKENLLKLINRDYTRDPETFESEDADLLIESLDFICKTLSKTALSFEFDSDDEKTPDLFLFPFDEWDNENDFKLPLSIEGTPSVVYRDKKSLVKFKTNFKSFLEEDDLILLVSIISKAIEESSGLFIFCN